MDNYNRKANNIVNDLLGAYSGVLGWESSYNRRHKEQQERKSTIKPEVRKQRTAKKKQAKQSRKKNRN